MLSDEFYRDGEIIYALVINKDSNNCNINKIYTIVASDKRPDINQKMKIRKELWAKARFRRWFNNPGLKPGVVDTELDMDFSPE